MPTRLASIEPEHLTHAPLKLALVQVLFQPVLAIEDPAEVHRFEEGLGAEWKFLEQGTAKQVKIEFGPNDGIREKVITPKETVWRFADMKERFVLTLSQTNLGLETTHYHIFAEFKEKLQLVLEVLVKVFAPETQKRLGVRYINEIEDNQRDLKNLRFFFNESLVCPIGLNVLGADLEGSFSELRFKRQVGLLVLRHGLVGPKKYLLDFDCFLETDTAFNSQEILSKADTFHADIKKAFIWSLNKKYLDKLQQEGK